MTEGNEVGSVNAEVGKVGVHNLFSDFRIHTSDFQYLSSVL